MKPTVLCCLLLLCLSSPGDSLTSAEVSQFTTSGATEGNTGLVGTVSITSSGTNYVLTSNGIPDHTTGTFPSSFNPNTISAQTYSYTFPQNPTVAAEKSCLPGGPIAFAINGVPIFNPFTANGDNAVEGDNAEVFDSCNGHPDVRGAYHYHQDPSCLSTRTREKLVGVALDGFPIYGPIDANGNTLTSADLDECNGRYVNGLYRYHITSTFPYVMGCYRGTKTSSTRPGATCSYALNSYAAANRAAVVLTIPALIFSYLLLR